MLDAKMKHSIAVHKLEPDLLAEIALGKELEYFTEEEETYLFRIADALGRMKRLADIETHDNWYTASYDETAEVLESMDFSVGWMNCRRCDGSDEKETLWYRKDGLVAFLDSFFTNSVNRFEVYCNLRPHSAASLDWLRNANQIFRNAFPEKDTPPEQTVYPLRFPVRTGIRRTIASLAEAGEFLPVWEKIPELTCVNYTEELRFRYKTKIWDDLSRRKISGATPGLRRICGSVLTEKAKSKT